ncbi:MAG: fatty acid desaturase [Pseudomonadota bacterium]
MVGHLLLSGTLSTLGIAAVVGLMFFIGTRFRGLNNIVHECSHFTFAADRKANGFFGKLACALILKSFAAYRKEHMSHHAHLGDYELDEDFRIIQRFRLEDPLTPRTILRHLVTPLTGVHVPYYCAPNLSGEDGRGWLALKLGLIGATVALAFWAPLTALVMVVAPFVVVYSAINYWTDCIDHGGLFGHEDELWASRNVIVPRWLRFLLFPRNDCYHLIHHLFPTLPSGYLDFAHERLMDHPAYRKRSTGDGALGGFGMAGERAGEAGLADAMPPIPARS